MSDVERKCSAGSLRSSVSRNQIEIGYVMKNVTVGTSTVIKSKGSISSTAATPTLMLLPPVPSALAVRLLVGCSQPSAAVCIGDHILMPREKNAAMQRAKASVQPKYSATHPSATPSSSMPLEPS